MLQVSGNMETKVILKRKKEGESDRESPSSS